MNLDIIRSGFKCAACYQSCDGSYNKIHKEIEYSRGNLESHIFHDVECEKLWKENQIKNPTCPWCYPDNIVMLTQPSQQTTSQQFVEAAKYGNLQIVTDIMDKSLNSSDKVLPISYHVAVFKAATFGQSHIVKYLLSEGNISNDWCGHAVIEATKNKFPSVICELYEGRIQPWEIIANVYLEKSSKIARDSITNANYSDQKKYSEIHTLIKRIQENKNNKKT